MVAETVVAKDELMAVAKVEMKVFEKADHSGLKMVAELAVELV